MQAACAMSSGGLPFGRRFRPAGALAADLVTEEYLTKHILHRHLHAREAPPRPPFHQHQQQHQPAPLPFDDNVHNRFRRQTEPLRNPLAMPTPAAAAPVPPAAGRPRRACCVSAARTSSAKAFQEQSRLMTSSKRSEDPDRKGVVSARLRKQQQQQQQQHEQRNRGTGWRAQAEREKRRASSRRKGPKEEGGNTRRKGGGGNNSNLPSITAFRRAYDEGWLPCSVLHHQAGGARGRGNGVKWHVPPEVLDTRMHLPLFLHGLLETQDPYRFLAIQGALDLIQVGEACVRACKQAGRSAHPKSQHHIVFCHVTNFYTHTHIRPARTSSPPHCLTSYRR